MFGGRGHTGSPRPFLFFWIGPRGKLTNLVFRGGL